MIDSQFIIRYTNGLYTTDPANAPTYEEFRDMFSSGQIISKEWAIDTIKSLKIVWNQTVVVAGAWYGTLGLMLKQEYPNIALTLLDIDPRCDAYLQNIIYGDVDVFSVTGDMYEYKYTEDIVINTACEHIPNVRWWLDQMPKGTTVVLQSNNFFEGEDHINCVSCIGDFIKQTSLSKILYSGSLVTPMYTRYMIIGRV